MRIGYRRKFSSILFVVAALLFLAAIGQSHATTDVRLAPGWGELLYQLPPPGTYQLPAIMPAADGEVITSDRKKRHLYDLMDGKIVLLSFIYSRCSDVNGCPLANAVLHKVQKRLAERPELAENVVLLTMSFDPEFDTPDVADQLSKSLIANDEIEWQFLTAENRQELQPILDGYGQFAVRVEVHDHDNRDYDYIHVLRVYLVDTKRLVRNIYSVSFLHSDVLLNDLETIYLETHSN